MISGILGLMPNIFKLGGKLIQDADKRAEYAFKVQDMMNNFMMKMLETKTNGFVDGLVKLAYAGDAIITKLFRPVFSIGIFIWGITNPEDIAKLHELGLMGDGAISVIFGSAPAWGVDRGLSKRKEKKKEIEWDEFD